jgi:hypothetical protein
VHDAHATSDNNNAPEATAKRSIAIVLGYCHVFQLPKAIMRLRLPNVYERRRRRLRYERLATLGQQTVALICEAY